MNVSIAQVIKTSKEVVYDIFKDDGVTPIASGLRVGYADSIPVISGTTNFSDFAGVIVADATSRKDEVVAKLEAERSNAEAVAARATTAIAEIDAKLADMETDIVPIA